VREKLIDTLTPLIVSGGYYKDTTARQFENYNTRNLPEVLGLGTAIDYHNLIGGGAVQARIYELKNYLRNAVEQEPFLALKSPAPDTLSAGITSVEVKDMDVRTVANRLEAEYRIVCRPIWAFGINGLRVSTSIFNNKKEIDRFIEALREIRKSN
jgi:selenocysteine lyase/cysteine desulfurase